MTAYFNENSAFPAAWLENLTAAGHIAKGEIDDRDIRQVTPEDLSGFDQCHFFAGIGVWSYALRLAGVPDDARVWTGSCPCQPFSNAGSGGEGADDERHLWPAWFPLIRECRPPVIFGEQVASSDGRLWLDAVSSDLESLGYTVGSADLCAAGVGAPHIRQRLFFVAYAAGERREGERLQLRQRGPRQGLPEAAGGREAGELAHPDARGQQGRARGGSDEPRQLQEQPSSDGETGNLGHADVDRAGQHPGELPGDEGEHGLGTEDGHHGSERPGSDGQLGNPHHTDDTTIAGVQWGPGAVPGRNPWANIEWIPCSDGKARPAQPRVFPLAHGTPGRLGRLRAYGNAIVPQVAAAFIEATGVL